jgi:hypothetical protein
VNEADLVLSGVSPKHPCDLLHLPERRLAPVGVSGTGDYGKGNTGAAARKAAAIDDLIAKGSSGHDGCVATAQAEGRLPVLCRATDNLQAHGRLPWLGGAYHVHLLSDLVIIPSIVSLLAGLVEHSTGLVTCDSAA